MKFSALNVDFNDPSLDPIDWRRPAHESITEHKNSLYFRCWLV